MPINITQVKGRLLKAEWEGHEVLSGKETKDGPYLAIPYGLYLNASLGLCATATAIRRIEDQGYKAENIKAIVDSKFHKSKTYVTDFIVDIEIESDIPKEELQNIITDANNCFVQTTIRNQPTMNVNIKLTS
jgi:uncharacterized OsmC-like protein